MLHKFVNDLLDRYRKLLKDLYVIH